MTGVTTTLGAGASPLHRSLHRVAQKRIRGITRVWDVALRVTRLPDAADLHVGRHAIPLDVTAFAEKDIYRGLYERGELSVIAELVNRGDFCIDVGANIGLVTLALAELAGPDGRVLAIEPSPLVLDRLREVTRDVETVTVVETAVSDSPGELPLDLSHPAHSHATLRTRSDSPGNCRVTVPVERLDRVAHAHGFDDVALLKVDVEGWERQVLAGAGALVAEARAGAVLFELNAHWAEPPDVDAMRSAGYEIFVIETRNRALRWSPVLRPLGPHVPNHQVNAVAVRADRMPRVRPMISR